MSSLCSRIMTENYHDTLPYFHVGELYTGEPCAPYTITRVWHGVQQVQEHIEGQKLPLLDICRQALTDYFRYMWLQSKETHSGQPSRPGRTGLGDSKPHVGKWVVSPHRGPACCSSLRSMAWPFNSSIVFYTLASFRETTEIQPRLEDSRSDWHLTAVDQVRSTAYLTKGSDLWDRLSASPSTIQQAASITSDTSFLSQKLAVELKSLEEAQWRRQATCLLRLSTKNNYARWSYQKHCFVIGTYHNNNRT